MDRARPDPIDYRHPPEYHRAMYEYEHRLRDAYEQMQRQQCSIYRFILDGYTYTVNHYGNVSKERDHHSYTSNYAMMQAYGYKIFSAPDMGYQIVSMTVPDETKLIGLDHPKEEDRSSKYRKLFWARYAKEEKRPI